MLGTSVPRWRSLLEGFGADPADTPEFALRKRILVGVSFLVAIAGVLWGALYFVYDEPLAGAIPMGYSALSAISLTVFATTRRYVVFRQTQLLLILLLPFALQLALGGFVPASAVILWALLAPVGAMMISSRRAGAIYFVVYVALVVAAQQLAPGLQLDNNLPSGLIAAFFVMNVAGVSTVVFVTTSYFVGENDRILSLLEEEQERSERLLLNVLPADIAEKLKRGDTTIARQYQSASVLFADIVGFTPMSASLEPAELIDLLNGVFSHFDDLVAQHGCEKIRTIGDSYMAAAGVPAVRSDHASALALVALGMRSHTGTLEGIELRIGINSGPAVAGVIGRSKFQYDIWGDMVNIASRMESHGVSGKIQVTETTYELLRDAFVLTPRGVIDVKGKGRMSTWFLEGEVAQIPV